jgi:uncharacterized protein
MVYPLQTVAKSPFTTLPPLPRRRSRGVFNFTIRAGVVPAMWIRLTSGIQRCFQFSYEQKQKLAKAFLKPIIQRWFFACVYLLLILFSECITTLLDPQAGMALHAIVLLALLLHSAWEVQKLNRRFLTILALAPMIRVLSLALPLAKMDLPPIYWYMVVGILLYLAAFLAGQVTDFSWRRMGWTWRNWPLQIFFGCVGILLGFVEYLILRPGPIVHSLAISEIWLPILILLVFTGFLEELLFRGMLQSAAMQLLGRYGLLFVAVLFAILHVGYYSLADLIFVLLIGLSFGWMVWKTRFLLGVSIAHGLTNIGLYILFPVLFSSAAAPLAFPHENVFREGQAIHSAVTESTGPSAGAFEPGLLGAIVDNDEPGFLAVGATPWLESTQGYQGSYRWAYASKETPALVITWLPALKECGEYEIRVFVPVLSGATESAHYQINSENGAVTIILNQSFGAGRWISLGIFKFDPLHSPSLQLSNYSKEDIHLSRRIGFDAVWWKFTKTCGKDVFRGLT